MRLMEERSDIQHGVDAYAPPTSCEHDEHGTSMIYRKYLIVLSIFALWMAAIASAQQQKLYSPQPEHKLLERFAGEWKFEKMSAPDDGSKPENLGSEDVRAELLGGFFVVCQWTGKLYGGDYKAVQTLGFDVDKSAYSGAWVDSTMSYQWQLNGSYDRDNKELVVQATGPGPNGGTKKYRERYKFDSADSITIVAQMLDGEKWITFMTTRLTRKKDTKTDSPRK